jgi:hypothetical protein
LGGASFINGLEEQVQLKLLGGKAGRPAKIKAKAKYLVAAVPDMRLPNTYLGIFNLHIIWSYN